MDSNTIGWLSLLILGLVAGAIAKALHPGKDPGGCIVTMIIGVAGAFLGGWIGHSVLGGEWAVNGFNFRSLLLAVGGAFILLFIYGLVTRRR